MPTSEAGRRAAFAEVSRRKKGGKKRGFEGMSTSRLESYAHEPLHKKKGKKRSGKGKRPPFMAKDQARALRKGGGDAGDSDYA